MVTPLADEGLPGMLVFVGIVAVWDGISVVNVRYVEFLTALCF